MVKGYYFNSVQTGGVHDRTYNSEDLCNYLKGIISNGVLMNDSANLQVMADSNMNILVKEGYGWIEGHKIHNDSDLKLTIDSAHSMYNRIDRVVFALNRTDREMQIYVKKGTAASSPIAPTLTQTEDLIELSLATILIGPNITSITQSMITDTRLNTSECGQVHALIEQVDTTTIFNQFEALLGETYDEFDVWFQGVKDTLAATSLLREYKVVYSTAEANEQTIAIPVTDLHYNDTLDILHVYINGFRKVEGVDYTKTATTITFKNPLPVAGTQIEITNWKSVDGSDAESVINIVEDLEEKINTNYKYNYITTGTNDNTALKSKCVYFFGGESEFAGIDENASGEIKVIGEINIDDSSDVTTVSGIASYFNLYMSANAKKKLVVDFSDCIINVNLTSKVAATSLFYVRGERNLTLKNLRIKGTIASNTFDIINTDSDVDGCIIDITNTTQNQIVGIRNRINKTILKDCEVKINNTSTGTSTAPSVIGIYNAISELESQLENKMLNCRAEINTVASSLYDICGFFGGYGVYDNCQVVLSNLGSGETEGFKSDGIFTNCTAIANGCKGTKGFSINGKAINCKAYAESTCQNGNATSGFFMTGEATNCDGVGVNKGTGSGYGFLLADGTKALKCVNCTGRGYYKTAGTSIYGCGFSTLNTLASQTLICIGCQVDSETKSGLIQSDSIRIQGTTAGGNASLIGNVLFKGISRHTGSNINETGNIVV